MRIINTIVLAFALLLGAIACNPTDEKGTAANGNNGRQVEPGETSGANGDPIKLGFCLELTGNAATFGVSAQKGAEIAIAEINESGGVLGRQITGQFDDNASVPAQAQTVASKLINQDHVDVLIGAVASSNSIAMATIAQEAKIPMVTPASTNPAVTIDEDGNPLEYVFRTCFTDDFQGEGIVDFAVNGPIKATRACIFYDADNDYSVGIWQTIKAVAASKGLEIVAEDSYLSTSEQDFRSRLSKFKQYEFDVLIVPGYYNQVAMIANQARELGLMQPLLGGDGFDSEDLWKNAGENIEGSYYTNHYAADDMDPAVQGFITKFKQTYGGAIPDAMAILTYDAVFVVADAIRRAGSTEPAAVAKALGETKDFKGAAGSITIDELHNAMKKLVVLEIGEGGSLRWVHTFDPGKAEEAPAENPCGEEVSE